MNEQTKAKPPLAWEVRHEAGGVVLGFSQSVAWLKMTPGGADELAKQLKKNAMLARGPR